MAVSAISSNILAQPQQPSVAGKPAVAAKPQTSTSDTVKISATAKALQEKTAAPAHTVRAAATGDLQAKAQLAKPTAGSTVEK
jgi:hypothetical protein